MHTVEGGQTFILSSEQGGQQVYQDSSGQQYIICDVASELYYVISYVILWFYLNKN